LRRRGRSEGAELEGENKRGGGWRGLNLCVSVMGGWVGSAIRKQNPWGRVGGERERGGGARERPRQAERGRPVT
jgi:hypothetical protein